MEYDPEAKTLTMADTSIGTPNADSINKLRNVAKPGIANFWEAMTEGEDADLTGQLGADVYVMEWERVKTHTAIWPRANENATEEEYIVSHNSVSSDHSDHLAHAPSNADREFELWAVLFLPSTVP